MSEPVIITSASNPIIKEVRALQDKKGRRNAKALLLEGYRLVLEAVHSGASVRYFVVSESFRDKARPVTEKFPSAEVTLVDDGLFSRIGETRTPQGIMAVVDMPRYEIRELLPRFKRLVALENLQDPGNLGTIIRTADACGFDAVLLSKDCVDPYNPKVVRSTMGSLFHLPILEAEDFYEILEELRSNNIRITAAHTRNAVPCWEAKLSDHIAIIIGNEGSGLTDKVLQLSDSVVMIPMDGRTESLNASAAASILLYESMRQRAVKNQG